MALTRYQSEILRLLAGNRKSNAGSYVAGGLALNYRLGTPRLSRDIDIFHDSTKALAESWRIDRETLLAAGYSVKTIREWSNFIEAEVCPDHVHMLVEIPPKVSVSSFMGYLKGKSSLMIYEKYPELKYKYRNREFWCRGYYVDTAGKNAKKIEEYIRHQLDEDKAGEQLTMPNF